MVESHIDNIAEIFTKQSFCTTISESSFKNIYFLIMKKRVFFTYNQDDELFKLLDVSEKISIDYTATNLGFVLKNIINILN